MINNLLYYLAAVTVRICHIIDPFRLRFVYGLESSPPRHPAPSTPASSAVPARSSSSRPITSRRGAAARATLVRVWSWGLSRVSKPRGQGSRWGQEQVRSRVLHNRVRMQVRVRVLVRVRVRIGGYRVRVRVRVPRLHPPPWLPAASPPRLPAPG